MLSLLGLKHGNQTNRKQLLPRPWLQHVRRGQKAYKKAFLARRREQVQQALGNCGLEVK